MKKLLRVISVTCLNSIFLVNLFCIVLASMIALPVSAQIACAGLNCSGGNQATFQGVQIGPCTGKFCVCATGGLHLWDFGDGGNSGSDPCVRRQITNAPNASTTFAGFAQNPLLIQGGMSENPTHVFSTATTFTVNHWFVQSGGIQHATFNITISGIGLSTLSSANTTWSCNDIENTFTGAIFYGPCMGTNLMTTDFTPPFNTGLYYTPSVMMDPQVHRGNRWNGGIYAQGAARWDGVTFQQVGQSIFKIHTQSPPFYPPSFNLPLGINPNDWFVPDPIGSPDICNEETSCTPSGITGGEGETRKKVASGEYTNPLYDGAITWQAEQQVFAALDANPAFQNEYPEVGQFYQDNQQSTIGKLHNIEKSTTQLYRSLPETREAIR